MDSFAENNFQNRHSMFLIALLDIKTEKNVLYFTDYILKKNCHEHVAEAQKRLNCKEKFQKEHKRYLKLVFSSISSLLHRPLSIKSSLLTNHIPSY